MKTLIQQKQPKGPEKQYPLGGLRLLLFIS